MELQQLHKFFQEVKHFDRVLGDDLNEGNVELALAQAKRVRNSSSMLIRALAQYRDQLQPKEGTSE